MLVDFNELINKKEIEFYNATAKAHIERIRKQLVKLLEWKDVLIKIQKEERAKAREIKRSKKGDFDLK